MVNNLYFYVHCLAEHSSLLKHCVPSDMILFVLFFYLYFLPMRLLLLYIWKAKSFLENVVTITFYSTDNPLYKRNKTRIKYPNNFVIIVVLSHSPYKSIDIKCYIYTCIK